MRSGIAVLALSADMIPTTTLVRVWFFVEPGQFCSDWIDAGVGARHSRSFLVNQFDQRLLCDFTKTLRTLSMQF
jgi:hypothetical protein